MWLYPRTSVARSEVPWRGQRGVTRPRAVSASETWRHGVFRSFSVTSLMSVVRSRRSSVVTRGNAVTFLWGDLLGTG